MPTSKYDAPKGSWEDRKELQKEQDGKLPRVPFAIFTETIMQLVCAPKFYITIVSNFSWVLQSSQKKIEGNGYAIFSLYLFFFFFCGGEGEKRVNKVHYGLGENSE